MKKYCVAVLAVIFIITLAGCRSILIPWESEQTPTDQSEAESPGAISENDKKYDEEKSEAAALAEEFGQRLKLVSLAAPEDIVTEDMRRYYGDLVSPELLAAWEQNPLNAPGRLVSSPWPDRIEVRTVQKISAQTYNVQGQIIEITSVEEGTDASAAKRPVSLIISLQGGEWKIAGLTLGEYEGAPPASVSSDPDTLTDIGVYVGQADGNFIEITIDGLPEETAAKTFMLTPEVKEVFNALHLETGDNIRVSYLPNEYGQNLLTNIELL